MVNEGGALWKYWGAILYSRPLPSRWRSPPTPASGGGQVNVVAGGHFLKILPPTACGGKGTGFVGSRQTTENPVARFPTGREGDHDSGGGSKHDKNTDTGSVPVSIAGLSESGVNAKRTGRGLPAATLNLSSGNAGSCCNRRVIRVFVIGNALWCFRGFRALNIAGRAQEFP